MSTRNKFIIAGLVILFIATGFFREFVFLNWNEQIRVTYYHSPDPHVATSMQWLGAFSYEALWWLKWPLTLLFSGIFAFLTLITVRITFSSKDYNRITLLAYAVIFVLSFLFYVVGWFIDHKATMDLSRLMAGVIETPAMLVILMASFMIHRRL